MRYPTTVRRFYQVYQPHHKNGFLYVQDTLRGSGFRKIEKVTREEGSFFLHVDGVKLQWNGHQEVHVEEIVGLPDIFSELFDWYLDSDFKQDLIGYDVTLREHFEDDYEARKIGISATLERLRGACDKFKDNSVLSRRAGIINDLTIIMERIDRGDYSEALEGLYQIGADIKPLQAEAKKWIG